MPFRLLHTTALGCLLAGCVVTAGCGPTPVTEAPTPVQQNLQSVGDAYLRATQRLNHPPANLTELMPSLKGYGKAEEVLRSPDDSQPFEIVWGVELRMLKARGSDIPILAYEKVGKDGVRNVLRGRSEVLRMSESELKSAKFPDGYKFPF